MNRYFIEVDYPDSTDASDDLYSTDGTAAGTVSLGFENIDPNFLLGSDLINFARRTFFIGEDFAGDGTNLAELYSTDGTPAGTKEVLYIGPDYDDTRVWIVGGTFIVSGTLPATNTPVIYASTDGVNFTQIATGVAVEDLSGNGTGIVVSHGIGYFAVPSGAGLSLWRTDGTAAGTFAIVPTGSTAPAYIAQVANGLTVFLSKIDVNNGTLWVTDGMPGGAQEIGARLGLVPQWGYGIATTGSRAVFSATDAAGNLSAWGTDGTTAGTQELTATGPVSTKLEPNSTVQLGNKVLFDGGNGLFATDGTTSGTTQLTVAEAQDRTVVGDELYFFEPQVS